jgi:hypothetical protein
MRTLLKTELILFLAFFLNLTFSKQILAAPADDGDPGLPGVGKINQDELNLPTDVNDIIGNLIQLVYAVAGIIFFFMFVLGGIRYLTAGGDEKAAASARATLTQAFIGLVIVVAAFLITQLVFNLFGIEGFVKLG